MDTIVTEAAFQPLADAALEQLSKGGYHVAVVPSGSYVRPGSLADGTRHLATSAYRSTSSVIARNPRAAIAIGCLTVAGTAFAYRRPLMWAPVALWTFVASTTANTLDAARARIHAATAPAYAVYADSPAAVLEQTEDISPVVKATRRNGVTGPTGSRR